jgi:microcystin-dependent protein
VSDARYSARHRLGVERVAKYVVITEWFEAGDGTYAPHALEFQNVYAKVVVFYNELEEGGFMKGKLWGSTSLVVALMSFSAPVQSGVDPYVGEVMWTGASYCPRGWTEANGQLLAISSNQALYSLYGVAYGGDGRSTFALPDLRGRSAVHFGSGSGLGAVRLGEKGGAETVALTSANLPSHNHGLTSATVTLNASAEAGDSPAAEARMLADGQRAALYGDVPADAGEIKPLAAESAAVGGQTDLAGTGSPVSIRSPYVAMRACIALVGTFPSRS